MQHRTFLSLTNEEIKQILTDIFMPSVIADIERDAEKEEIHCRVFLEWTTKDNYHSGIEKVILRDPFLRSGEAIQTEYPIDEQDIFLYEKFCMAKGINPWLEDNPYLDTRVRN